MGGAEVGGERFAFDDDVWAEEVERYRERAPARVAATVARADIERSGSRVRVLACEEQGPGGTRLAGCAKVYVPIGAATSGADFGFVFALRTDRARGEVLLRIIAFGERHPARGRSVYERAHRRLHGRYPDRV